MTTAALTERAAFNALAEHCLTASCCRRNPDQPLGERPECPTARGLYRSWRQVRKESRR
jgi:hypothetical protein